MNKNAQQKYLLRTMLSPEGFEVFVKERSGKQFLYFARTEAGQEGLVTKKWVLTHRQDILNLGVDNNCGIYPVLQREGSDILWRTFETHIAALAQEYLPVMRFIYKKGVSEIQDEMEYQRIMDTVKMCREVLRERENECRWLIGELAASEVRNIVNRGNAEWAFSATKSYRYTTGKLNELLEPYI